jgi:hypothetical protein
LRIGKASNFREVIAMRIWKVLVPGAAAAALAFGAAQTSAAQVALQIGPAPACPYGYYDYAPYQCAPYGYYGPEWFDGGLFIGAGPWYHGHEGFYGHVDRHYDPRYGYHGAFPQRGERFDNHHDFHDFHGSYMRDGHGHERDEHGH